MKENPHTKDIVKMIKATASYFGVKQKDLIAPTRGVQKAADARAVLFSLIRQKTTLTNAQIGEAVGGRTHAAVIYACQRAKNSRKLTTQRRAIAKQLKGAENE